MREDVLIVLNEREPLKKQRAAELETQLNDRAIAATRLLPERNVAKIIKERLPRVLVLDYILGDFGTALEILAELEDSPVAVILWTDEPSLNAAVSAMKQGAADFIELEAPRSMERLLSGIEKQLITAENSAVFRKQALLQNRPTELTINSPAMRQLAVQAEALARSGARIAVLLGETGSGRSRLSRFIHERRPRSGAFFEIEVDLWAGSAADLFPSNRSPGLLSDAATVLLEHAEFDIPGMVEEAVRWAQSTPTERSAMLLVGTSAAECAALWTRLTDAPILHVPGLADRSDDLLPLIVDALKTVPRQPRLQEPDWSAALLASMLALGWPGNVRQFRSAVINAVCVDRASSGEQHLLDALASEKSRWEKYHRIENRVPTLLEARRAFDDAAGNYRVAAALLATGVPQLRLALSGASLDAS